MVHRVGAHLMATITITVEVADGREVDFTDATNEHFYAIHDIVKDWSYDGHP